MTPMNLTTAITARLLLGCHLLLLSMSVAGQAQVSTGPSQVTVTSPLRPEFQLAAGESRTPSITVRNDSASPLTVELLQVDFSLKPSGRVHFDPTGDLDHSNRTWIHIASQATIPANATIEIPYTIQVPPRAAEGTHWSMIVVEPQDSTTFTDNAGDNAEVRTSVTVSFRYGVIVLVNVGRPAEQQLQFTEPVFSGEHDNYHLSLTLQNPGVFLVSAKTWLELYDAAGERVARVEAGELRIYPHASLVHRFELGRLEPQTYQAIIIADDGGENVYGVRYTIPVSATDEGQE